MRALVTSSASAGDRARADYIERQLHPDRVADGADRRARLALPSRCAMSTRRARRGVFRAGDEGRTPARQRRRPAPERIDDRGAPDAHAGADGAARKGRASRWSSCRQQKILRAAYSERQLEEVMVDFWFNHFNVFAGKGATQHLPHRVRARRDPAARARQVPRPPRCDGEEPGDAVLPGQLAERGSRKRRRCDERPADGRGARPRPAHDAGRRRNSGSRDAGSTRTTAAS